MKRLPFVFLLLALAGVPASAKDQRGAFVVTLGRDTTSVERFTRQRDRLVVEMVGRSPRVLRRTFIYTYEKGALASFEMMVVPPGSEVPTQLIRGRVDGDTLRTETQTGTAPKVTAAVAFPRGSLLVASSSPWAGYEGEVRRLIGSRADTLGGRMLFIGARETERWRIQRIGRDSVEIWNTHADVYRARVDGDGNLLGVRPVAGTFQAGVQRTAWPDLDAMAVAFQSREQTGAGLGSLSPRDSVRATVGGGARVMVDYSRPAKRGRVLFGSLVPYGELWRTGANAATLFRTDRDLDFAGIVVPAGSYSLWTVPGPDSWKLVFNSETGQWGTQHDPVRDRFTVDMKVETLPQVVERFTITVEDRAPGGVLHLDWDTTRASATFSVVPR